MYIHVIKKRLTSFQLIILGFAAVILLGCVLLMLPAATRTGKPASPQDALFTAVSAVCVTGLVVQDTATYWSAFGQAVILFLIQIGGLGVISITVLFSILSGRRISLLERTMLEDTLSAPQLSGLVRMTAFLIKVALCIELAGAALMMPVFCRRYGTEGIWMSVFHSVSAFCNAGFDIMGAKTGTFSSLTSFRSDPWITLVICLLIISGGIGFFTWRDIAEKGPYVHRYRMQTKVILAVTSLLIIVPTILFFFGEFEDYPVAERFCLSLFQAVTPRTAGFNTANLASLSGVGQALLIILMLVGGSPGSTAGGIKTTTLAVLLANSISVFRRRNHARLFGRRIEDRVIKNASTVAALYFFLAGTGSLILSAVEGLPVGTCLFETASAVGTVGLSLGITPSLGLLSRIVLMLLMFWGRVGAMTLVYAAVSYSHADTSQYPVGKIAVG